METVKARKQGNAIMVTLASKLAVKEGQEFYYYKDDEGIISLIPKAEDFFQNAEKGDFVDDEDKLAMNFVPKVSELDD
ncbi:type II toxin-antitoxin system PemI/MazE family antitoxin [Enterococcus sp. LJL128]|uniref:type II toxin-antitoxin system PemI/MazE family antitoxin n=1 Tax=Enterococcus sp. LJL51 TaxID=3416656 RepID=UPI003CFB8727